MWSHLYIFAVVAIAFGVKPKNSFAKTVVKKEDYLIVF